MYGKIHYNYQCRQLFNFKKAEDRMKTSLLPRLIVSVICFCLVFGLTSPVLAQGIFHGSTIPSGVVVDGDAFLSGQEIVIDGTVNGNVVVVGNQVTVNGMVNGSLIALGQNAFITGKISGGTYIAALTLEIGPEAQFARDLYYGGVSLVTSSGAAIQRDLYALGLDAGLSGRVGRDLHTVIGPIQLFNGLMRLLGFEDMVIDLHFKPQVPVIPTVQPLTTPTLTPAPTSSSSSMSTVLSKGGNISMAVYTYPGEIKQPTDPAVTEVQYDLGTWALRVLRGWVVLFLLGLIALWAFSGLTERAGAQLCDKPLCSLGYGLLVLVISILLYGAAILLKIVILVLGLWIGSLGLWDLSLAFWIAGFSCLGLSLVALWAFSVYGTKIIVAFTAANWLLGKASPAIVKYKALPLLLGTLLYTLLRSIPILGWVIGLLVTAVGMGAVWMAYRSRPRLPMQNVAKKPKQRSTPVKPLA